MDDGCAYSFRCEVFDSAGNSEFGDIESVTIDTEPPTNVRFTYPFLEWANNSFDLAWAGEDEVSGIDCFHVQWSDDGVGGIPVNWYVIRGDISTDCIAPEVMTSILFDENNDEPVDFVLKFNPKMRYMVEDVFLPDQITPLEDGTLLVRAPMRMGDWITSWPLSHGEHLEVVKPDRVRKMVMKKLEALRELYGEI